MGKLFKFFALPALITLSVVLIKNTKAETPTASKFNKYCAENPETCKKEDLEDAERCFLTCSNSESQVVDEIFVHAGD